MDKIHKNSGIERISTNGEIESHLIKLMARQSAIMVTSILLNLTYPRKESTPLVLLSIICDGDSISPSSECVNPLATEILVIIWDSSGAKDVVRRDSKEL
jgi:hypothetical protein